MTTYTKGPLYIRPPLAQGGGYNIHANKREIVGNASEESDAILWSAAPELFDALTWALTQIDDDLDLDNQTALEHAKNILKKVKGGV